MLQALIALCGHSASGLDRVSHQADPLRALAFKLYGDKTGGFKDLEQWDTIFPAIIHQRQSFFLVRSALGESVAQYLADALQLRWPDGFRKS